MTGTKQNHVVSRLLKRSYNKKAGGCSTSTLQSCQWIDTLLPFRLTAWQKSATLKYTSGSKLSCLISHLFPFPHTDLLRHSILRRLRLATLTKPVASSIQSFTSLFCFLHLSLLVLYFRLSRSTQKPCWPLVIVLLSCSSDNSHWIDCYIQECVSKRSTSNRKPVFLGPVRHNPPDSSPLVCLGEKVEKLRWSSMFIVMNVS